MTHLHEVLANPDEISGLEDQEADSDAIHQVRLHILQIVALKVLQDERLHCLISRHDNHYSVQEKFGQWHG